MNEQFSVSHLSLRDIQSKTIICNDVVRGEHEYFRRFTFETFAHHCDDEPCVIRLSEGDFKSLKADAVVCDRLGTQPRAEHVHDLSVINQIKEFMEKHPNGVFAKVADASPKDGRDLRSQEHSFVPLKTPEEMWTAFCSSRRVLTFLTWHEGSCDLVLRPWNYMISPHNEYRIFVFRRRLVAISQQHLYRTIEPTCTPDRLYYAVQHWLESHHLTEDDVVMDVFYDHECGVIRLIECNPAWRGAGSALFTWEQLSQLNEDDNLIVPIRYTSE